MFEFVNGLIPGDLTLNIERSHFDELLLRHATEAGAIVQENCGVDEIIRLADGDVAVRAGGQTITARYLFDCTGQNTLLGRHLNVRKSFRDPELQKVAYFAHFDHVERSAGQDERLSEHHHVQGGLVLDHRFERIQDQHRLRHAARTC